MWTYVVSMTQCQPEKGPMGSISEKPWPMCYISQEKWPISQYPNLAYRALYKPHHVHTGSLLAYFFLNYVLNGTYKKMFPDSWMLHTWLWHMHASHVAHLETIRHFMNGKSEPRHPHFLFVCEKLGHTAAKFWRHVYQSALVIPAMQITL